MGALGGTAVTSDVLVAPEDSSAAELLEAAQGPLWAGDGAACLTALQSCKTG